MLGRRARLGDAAAADARLVMVSITPFGAASAGRAEPVTDLTLLAGGGPVWSCGYDDHTLPRSAAAATRPSTSPGTGP